MDSWDNGIFGDFVGFFWILSWIFGYYYLLMFGVGCLLTLLRPYDALWRTGATLGAPAAPLAPLIGGTRPRGVDHRFWLSNSFGRGLFRGLLFWRIGFILGHGFYFWPPAFVFLVLLVQKHGRGVARAPMGLETLAAARPIVFGWILAFLVMIFEVFRLDSRDLTKFCFFLLRNHQIWVGFCCP